MATEQARKAAKHIIEDQKGADYYQDTKLLANYLKETLGMTLEEAERKAESIQRDRKGANYYEDVKILAGFIEPRADHKAEFRKLITKITTLYADSTIMVLLNDIVAIGTWPTPEKPKPEIPFPERTKALKKLIGKLVEIGDRVRLNTLIK